MCVSALLVYLLVVCLFTASLGPALPLAAPFTPAACLTAACTFLSTNTNVIGHVNEYPRMQFFTGISRNAQSKSFMLSLTDCVSGNSKMMQCGILIADLLLNTKSKTQLILAGRVTQ